jgi:hypothetical protein
VERLFGTVAAQPTEQTILLLLGAVNDALNELQIVGIRANSYSNKTILLHAASPAMRVLAITRLPEIEQRVQEIYLRRGGILPIEKYIIRVAVNLW